MITKRLAQNNALEQRRNPANTNPHLKLVDLGDTGAKPNRGTKMLPTHKHRPYKYVVEDCKLKWSTKISSIIRDKINALL